MIAALRSGTFKMLPFSTSNHRHMVEHDGRKWFVVLHGTGLMENHNGVRAKGEFRHDALHGHGEYVYENGIMYVGSVHRWDACGAGTVVFLDGRVLDGTFSKDCPVEGTLTLPTGLRYLVKYDGKTEIPKVRRQAARP